MFLILESILENLTCDNCKKYLSVPPIKVYPNKHVHCGRCSEENDDGRKSFYENIAGRSLFKCINRYDGCPEVLPFSKVSTHEEICKSALYSCPNCPLVPKMSSLLLINHFKESHKDSVLKNCNFPVNTNGLNLEVKKYMYIKEDFIFIICISVKDNYVSLNTIHIGKPDLSPGITQKFTLSYSFDGTSEKYTTEKRPCCIYEDKYFHDDFKIYLDINKCSLNVEVDLDTRKAQKLILLPLSSTERSERPVLMDSVDICNNELYLNETFKTRWLSQYTLHFTKKSLVNINNKLLNCCGFCQNKFNFFSVNQSIYKCTKCYSGCDTFICSKCYFFGITKCDNGNDYEFTPVDTEVFKCIEYFCKWNCSETYFSWNLQKHEYNCTLQENILCPIENCKRMGALSEMLEHVESHEGIVFYKGHSLPLNLILTKKFYSKKEVVIRVLNHFVHLKWKKVNNKYIFSLYMKRCNKIPIAVVSINKNTDIFIDSFVLDVKDNPLLLIILRDI